MLVIIDLALFVTIDKAAILIFKKLHHVSEIIIV